MTDTRFPFQVKIMLVGLFFRELRFTIRQSILVHVMFDLLKLSTKASKKLYHLYESIYCVLLIVSAIICDSYLGHRNQFYIYIVCIIILGYIPFLSSVKELSDNVWVSFNINNSVMVTLTALLSPVFVPLVGDQLDLPKQYLTLRKYVIFAYWLRHIAAIFGTIIPPIIVSDLPICYHNNCYPYLFFFSYCMMLIEGTLMLAFLKRIVKKKMAIKNVFYKSFQAIFTALYVKIKYKNKERHWLDHAKHKYAQEFLDDVKRLKVIYMLMPIIAYRTMFAHQQVAWQFQANRMDGYIGVYFIGGELVLSLNPILIVIMIPIFTRLIYPACAKKNWLVTPLQRICTGGYIYTLAFIWSSILLWCLNKEKHTKECAPGRYCLYIYNPNSCVLNVTSSLVNESIAPMDFVSVDVEGYNHKKFTLNTNCNNQTSTSDVKLFDKFTGMFYTKNTEMMYFMDNPIEHNFGDPIVRVLSNARNNLTFYMRRLNFPRDEFLETPIYYDTFEMYPGKYAYSKTKNDPNITVFNIWQGGVYVLLLNERDDQTYDFKLIVVTKRNQIHVFWIIPQYFFSVIAEILIFISYNEFCYMESPRRMKSFAQSVMLCMNSLNNPLILLIDWLFEKPLLITLFFIGLNLFTTLTITLLSWNYTYAFQKAVPVEAIDKPVEQTNTN